MAKNAVLVGIKRPPTEVQPGIYSETIDEVLVRGVLYRKPIRWQGGELSHNRITANQRLSLIATGALLSDFADIAYVVWQGRKWVVSSVAYERPRLTFTLGGIYDGQ